MWGTDIPEGSKGRKCGVCCVSSLGFVMVGFGRYHDFGYLDPLGLGSYVCVTTTLVPFVGG